MFNSSSLNRRACSKNIKFTQRQQVKVFGQFGSGAFGRRNKNKQGQNSKQKVDQKGQSSLEVKQPEQQPLKISQQQQQDKELVQKQVNQSSNGNSNVQINKNGQQQNNKDDKQIQSIQQEEKQLTKVLSDKNGDQRSEDDVLIEFHNVHKSFGDKHILRGVSFKIYKGEAVGVIGASGTGKSTALRLIAGLLVPDEGDIIVKGKLRKGLIADAPQGQGQAAVTDGLKIGMVFQSGALFDSLTVGENVGFLLYEHSTLPSRKIEALVQESLSCVGLKNVEHLYPSQLSGGMRKRVALARAIINDQNDAEQILMYDEPTAGLDPVASTVVENLIRSLHTTDANKNGRNISSYVVVTHQHSTIMNAVDRLIFLHKGKVVWSGTVEEYNTTDEPIVRQFASGSLEGPIKYR